MTDRSLRAGRDDEVVSRRAMRGEGLGHRGLDALDRQRLAVDLQPIPVPGCAAEQVARGVHPGLGGALRAADSGQFGVRLHAPAIVEERAVDRQFHALGAQTVGEPQGKGLGDNGARDPERLDGSNRHLLPHRRVREASRAHQLVRPVLLGRVQFMEAQRREARDLHRPDRDVLDPVLLGIEEGVGDPDRHLVPELGRAVGVGIHEDVRHARDHI